MKCQTLRYEQFNIKIRQKYEALISLAVKQRQKVFHPKLLECN